MTEGLPIELVSGVRPKPPRLPGAVIQRRDLDGAIDALLADVYLHAHNCVRTFGDFHIAIAGAPGLDAPLMRLMFDPAYREFPWSRTRVWTAEELVLPEGDERLVGPRLREIIVEPSGMPAEQFHAIDLNAGAPGFERELREHLGWRQAGHDRLDLVILALMTGAQVGLALPLPVEGALAAAAAPTSARPAAIAMTQTMVNAARMLAVLAAGPGLEGEALRLANAPLSAEQRQAVGGAYLLRPIGAGELRWYLDDAACTPV